MISIVSVFLFFLYIYGYGYSATRFLRNVSLEVFILRMGVGLAVFPIIGLILNIFAIPLDWRIFLALALFFPVFDLIRQRKNWRTKFPKPDPARILIAIALAIIFALSTWMYCGGSFQYPWLEDDDSWQHAASIKYIAAEKNLNAPSGMFQYLNPYPPGYDIIMAVMHQTHPSLYWTLKFFNGLIVALSLLFFFIFVQEFTKNRYKALNATFFLAIIPCYLTHFIWAHSLVVTLFFPAFYCLLKLRDDKRFLLPLVVVIMAIFITQPTQSIKFVILFLILVGVDSLIRRRLWKTAFLALLIAVIASMFWWGPVIVKATGGNLNLAMRNSVIDVSTPSMGKDFLHGLFSPTGGTGTRAYKFREYFIFPPYNLVNNPRGIGFPLAILAIAGFILCTKNILSPDKEKKIISATIIYWFLFTFLGVNSVTFNLPIGLFAFRFWMLLAIPVSLLAAEAVYWASRQMPSRFIRWLVIFFLIYPSFLYCGREKLRVNILPYRWGADWGSGYELKTYVWLREHLAPGTKVFSFTKNWFVIGMDMQADFWTPEYQRSFHDAINLDLEKLYGELKKNKFSYFVIGAKEEKEFGAAVIAQRVAALEKSPYFRFVYGVKDGAKIFEIL